MTSLDSMIFAPLLITDVFESMAGSSASYDKSKLATSGNKTVPFVSRTRARNGIDSFCAMQESDPEPGGAITIGLDTQTVAYQPVPFYTSQNIQVLRHPKLDAENGPILATLISAQMARFSWGGNGATLGRLRKSFIMVPVVDDGAGGQIVDWNGLNALGLELSKKVRAAAVRVRETEPDDDDDLPELAFSPMFIVDDKESGQSGLFRTHKGKRLTKADRRPGRTPFVTGSRNNNSIADYARVLSSFPAGWLTLIYNGDGGTGHAKYQPVPFNASDDVIVLEPVSPKANEDALLVLVTILTENCVTKFGFGYKLTLHRLHRQKIMVPTTAGPDGEKVVDWAGMTAYGRALRVRTERALDSIPAKE